MSRVDIVYDGRGNVISSVVVADLRSPADKRRSEIDAELIALDAKLARPTEDLWAALISLSAAVPAHVQEVMARKAELRNERAALT